MNVNYEYYRLFYYVCKYHSITRAANVLRMSQPNVTRALNRLEEQLGCKLLVRSTRGVTMTPEGEVLFAHVEIAQEQLQAGESELAGITALESGALTISASETALNVFLLDKLREFHRRYPGVRLRIANHSTPQAIRALGRGLGLGYVPQNFAKDALAAGDVFTIQLKEEIPTRHVVLVQDGGRVPNAAAREFARMLNSSVTQQNAP